ncbi:LOW QUALITY PROTEIN: hypothetical protein M8C21_004834 [Ambrosia artemisiifolia]|uniref:NAD(P)-binding protein n=1 Tax=Ambrosia artemisiifolia TaxID=4212 RepID=A0AAD5CLK3_AMBAR|nr:LOW QUALITY PROTEIN: hypothetical protein M8C21_004834 [Ambrosia artemisiifolia]
MSMIQLNDSLQSKHLFIFNGASMPPHAIQLHVETVVKRFAPLYYSALIPQLKLVVWITGASSRIGEVLAKQLAALGAKIIISARNEPELEIVKKKSYLNLGTHEEILPLDLSSDAIRDVVEKVESLFGGVGVDYVIHNATFERIKEKHDARGTENKNFGEHNSEIQPYIVLPDDDFKGEV